MLIWKKNSGSCQMYKVIIDFPAEQDLTDLFFYITETLKTPDEENGIISSDPAVGTESLKEKLLHKKRKDSGRKF